MKNNICLLKCRNVLGGIVSAHLAERSFVFRRQALGGARNMILRTFGFFIVSSYLGCFNKNS